MGVTMRKRMKTTRPSHATVVAYVALFVALGAGAMAASHLGKNTVGTKQLKKNAVTTAKIKNEAVTAAKVKKGTLTGTQINASTLGTVPTADRANTAEKANTLAAPEDWHQVGAPGEPRFLNSWKNLSTPGAVAFYKDHEGVVHLRGEAFEGEPETPIFQLPSGYRPARHEVLGFAAPCSPCQSLSETGVAIVEGTEAFFGDPDGAV